MIFHYPNITQYYPNGNYLNTINPKPLSRLAGLLTVWSFALSGGRLSGAVHKCISLIHLHEKRSDTKQTQNKPQTSSARSLRLKFICPCKTCFWGVGLLGTNPHPCSIKGRGLLEKRVLVASTTLRRII